MSEPIGTIWGQPGLAPAIRIAAMAVPAIALGEVWRDGLRGLQDVRLASFLEKVLIPGAGIGLMYVLLTARPSEPLVSIGAMVGAYWLAACLAGIALRHQIHRLAVRPSYAARAWLAFALFLSLESGLLYLLQWTDQLLVGLFMTAADVGVYTAAVRLASLAAVPLIAVNSILAPTMAGMFGSRDREQLRQTYARFTWATLVLGLAIGSAVILLGRQLLDFFGPEFEFGYAALVIITVGHVVNAGTGSSGVLLGMTGHVRWRLFNAGATAILNVALNWLLIPVWGITGSAVATSSAIIAINLLQVVEVRLVLGFWGYDIHQLGYWFQQAGRLLRSTRPSP